MPPKSKVEKSDNYNQIMDWIKEGKSSRYISTELEKQFGEKIGHNAINNFRNKQIKSEALEIVDRNLKKEKSHSIEKDAEIEKENKRNEVVQSEVNNIELENQRNKELNGLADATAEQYMGLIKVGSNFVDDYYDLKAEAKKENSKVTQKDVVDYSYKASRLVLEYGDNNESDVNVNINNVMTLEESLERTRQKYQEAKQNSR